MDNSGLQPPITPPPATPPPVIPTPEPIKEEPIIQPPPNPTVKKAKKFLPKLAVGTLMVALLVGGLVLGKNLLLEKQRPVEKLAATGICSGSWTCTCTGPRCQNQPPYTYNCATFTNTDKTTCTGGNNNQGNYCMTDSDWELSGGCTWTEGGGDTGICDNSSVTAVYCRGNPYGYVIDDNWTNDCPNLAKESGKIYELYCYNTSGTLCSAICREKPGVGDSCGDGCVKYLCPYGDTNSDGKCDERDCGVSWNFYEDNGCPGISCGSDCCQIDYTQDKTYCGFKETAWNCTVLPGPCEEPSPNPSPSGSPSPSPSVPPTVACVDLTASPAPALNQTVTFTCKASFSSGAPVAFFQHKIGTGNYVEDPTPYPISTTTKTASKQMTISQTGNWIVQCKVCTDQAATTCTTWGQAK